MIKTIYLWESTMKSPKMSVYVSVLSMILVTSCHQEDADNDKIECHECGTFEHCNDETGLCEEGVMCGDSVCIAPQYCDQTEEICKTGTLCGEIICKDDEICSEDTLTCLKKTSPEQNNKNKCGNTYCVSPQYCDLRTNTCKNGTFCLGEICFDDQYCDDIARICKQGTRCGEELCKENQYCDEDNHTCKEGKRCGESFCREDQYCEEDLLVCKDGIVCGETVCRENQYCDNIHTVCIQYIPCGDNLCQGNQYCDTDGFTCKDGLICGDNLCVKNQYCDEDICKTGVECGNVLCKENQYCDAESTTCKDGTQCGDKICTTLQYCDEVSDSCIDGLACGTDLCRKNQFCDEETDTCKDGTGCGEHLCKEDQYCDVDTCKDGTVCGSELCTETQSCDPYYHKCINTYVFCGSAFCLSSQHCDAETVTCLEGDTCGDSFCTKDQHCNYVTEKCEDGVRCGSNICKSPKYCDSSSLSCKTGQVCGDSLCTANQVCSDNQCHSCGENELICKGECVNPLTSTSYCGASGSSCQYSLGTKCFDGQFCDSGMCKCHTGVDCMIGYGEIDCGPAQLVCTGERIHACVENKTSLEYCGCNNLGRGTRCIDLPHTVNTTCEEGKCLMTCEDGWADCNGNIEDGCEADLTDSKTCGSCSNYCLDEHADSVSCAENQCQKQCKDGYEPYNGECIDINTSLQNCGQYGHACEHCEDGTCSGIVCDENGYIEMQVTAEDGTEKSIQAYCISTENQIRAIQAAVSEGLSYPETNTDNAYFLLDDISINGSHWYPIGTQTHPFNGYVFGNHKKISTNSAIKAVNDYAGVFGYIKNTLIKDLSLDVEVEVLHNVNYIGGLAGYADNSRFDNLDISAEMTGFGYTGLAFGTLRNSFINHTRLTGSINIVNPDNIPERPMNFGALAGSASNGEISDCTSDITVTTELTNIAVVNVGGFLGGSSGVNADNIHAQVNIQTENGNKICGYSCNLYNGVLQNSSVSGTMTGYINVAGLADHATGTIKDTYTDVEIHVLVKGNTSNTGSAAGFVGQINNGTIENCHSIGDIYGDAWGMGGFAAIAVNSTIKNSYHTGDIISDDHSATAVGGFVGTTRDSTIKNSYSVGRVECGSQCGGFVGYSESTDYTDCYAAGTVQVSRSIAGGFTGFGNGTYTNCASYVNIDSTAESGGFVGFYSSSYYAAGASFEINNCYHIGAVKGTDDVGGLIGRSFSSDDREPLPNVNTFYTFSDFTNPSKSGGLVGTQLPNNKLMNIQKSYFYQDGCHGEPLCLSGNATSSSIFTGTPFILNAEFEPVLSAGGSKLINILNLGKTDSDTKFVNARCTIDFGEGSQTYTLPIIPTIRPDFCTMIE